MAFETPEDFDRASVPELVELLRDPGFQRRADAACALGDRLRARELAQLDESAREALHDALEDPVPAVRIEAAIALAEARETRATQVLLDAMQLRSVRLDAIRALGTMHDPTAVAPLTRVMTSFWMPWADRLQAAAALCALSDPAGAAYLESKLTSRKTAERAAAMHFIGESHHPRARALLEPLLTRATEPLRDVAVRALGLHGDPAARTALEAARTTADEALVADIEHALALLAPAGVRP